MKRKLLTETLVCPRERLVIISYTTGLSFAKERIGPLAAIVTTVFYLLALYLLVLPNTPENLFASIYSEALIKTIHQHLLLLVGFDTLIYQKYYDTPPILVGHQPCMEAPKVKPPTMSDADCAKELAQRAVVTTDQNKGHHIQRQQDTELAKATSFVSYAASQGDSGGEGFIVHWRQQGAAPTAVGAIH
jgi:hypothetical protein